MKNMHPAILQNDRPTINAWAMYDWANSVYALVITSAIFPAYYNSVTSAGGTPASTLSASTSKTRRPTPSTWAAPAASSHSSRRCCPIPKTENNAGYFSFFDVCEKLAMMCGLVMWGFLDDLTGSMRNSIIALGTWFSIGLVLLVWVQRMREPVFNKKPEP